MSAIIREEYIGGQRLILGDCIERMAEIPDGSVDLVLTDPPYGTTACKWDAVIPFEPMWAQVRRVLKPNGAAVFTASQPFTSALVMSNPKGFRYCWVWDKRVATGFAFAKHQPMRAHEEVCVFGGKFYNPQMVERTAEELRRFARVASIAEGGDHYAGMITQSPTREKNKHKFPSSVIRINGVVGRSGEKVAHPTQKPIALMEYLIRTYTNPGETVLDFTMGSGTTGVACVNTGRAFIGIERDPDYFAIAERRIAEAQPQLMAAE